MSAVIVLNASYEPISRTSLSRAVALVLQERAEIEEADPLRELRHKAGSMVWPKVIRLLKYVKIPFRYAARPWSKSGVLVRDSKKCAYCLKAATTVDHVFPRSRGGKDSWDNTVAACVRCNSKKADKTLKEAGMVLLFEPTTPMNLRVALH